MTEGIKVLDHGFVRLVRSNGDDSSIVQAARVSYGAGTKTAREDAALIDYLIRNSHTSPLEMVNFTFHMKLPIFVARQIIRHRTARVNEYSMRYSEAINEFYLPEADRILGQGKTNKQGSEGKLSEVSRNLARDSIYESCVQSFELYHRILDLGVSRELARIVLPVATYTEWYWNIDLNNLFKFLTLRLDEHAQWETRQYAEAITSLVQPIVPTAYESWRKYYGNQRNAVK